MTNQQKAGFTLIEIVLVMAIAGLILVIVFLAVEGAQRSRRDQERKTDAGRMLAAAEQCVSSNQGNYNSCMGTGATVNTSLGFLSPNEAPGGGTYSATHTAAAVSTTKFGVFPSVTCPGDATVHPIAVEIQLEQGGVTYCVGS
jgi:prepilin-type N-terminal cleavage/methylation domain-containing protein